MLEECICGKELPQYRNFCSWDCQVKSAKDAGYELIAPNNLPVKCITATKKLLECAHGDEPTYQFPVDIQYVGNTEDVTTRDPDDGTIVFIADEEQHALVFFDEQVALTLFETCYTLWDLSTGLVIYSNLLDPGRWKLTKDSLEKIHSRKMVVYTK